MLCTQVTVLRARSLACRANFLILGGATGAATVISASMAHCHPTSPQILTVYSQVTSLFAHYKQILCNAILTPLVSLILLSKTMKQADKCQSSSFNP